MRQAIWVLCCTCMCVAGPAYAELFKCLSPAGELSVQSRVCPSEWKVENFDGDAELVAIIRTFDDMREKMKRGDAEGALSHFTQVGRVNMGKAFERLGPRLPNAGERLGRVVEVTYGDRLADLTIERVEQGTKKAFSVIMLKTEDGVWKIDGM